VSENLWLCSGPGHEEPTLLERSAFDLKTNGRPFSRCRRCRHWHEVKNPGGPTGLVPALGLARFARELIDRCGTAEQAGRESDVTPATLLGLAARSRPTVRRLTAARLLIALHRRRRHDRLFGMSERFRQTRKSQALIEAKRGFR
jgi:hypothetical protein